MADFLPPSNDRHSSGKPYDRITQNPKAKISITPPQLGFGSIPAGGTSLSQYVTVINVGDKDVTLADIIVGGSFGISHEPLGVLKPGEEFQIDVSFEPTHTGIEQGSLTIEAGAVEGGRVIRLLGSGAGDDPIDDNSLKANAMAVGINPTSNNLGLFSGTIIPADRTVKQALQILSNYSIGLKGQVDVQAGSLFDAVDEFTLKYDELMAQVAEAEEYAAALKTQADAATAAIIALGGDVNTLETVVSTQGAAITTTQLSVTNILGSVAQHELTLIAQDSRINTVQTVTDSHELNLAEIETTLSTQGASITSHQTAITGLNGSVASMGSTLTAEQAKIVTNANAITALGSSVATMNTSLSTAIGNNSASITSQSTAISTLTDSMATMNTTLTAGINANTASIGTQATVIAGLGARLSVRLDVNNKVIGWIANNDGASGGLDFVVDYFRIWNAAGSLSRAPFEFVSGELYIKNAHIENLSIGTNKLAVDSVTESHIVSNGGGYYGPLLVVDQTITLFPNITVPVGTQFARAMLSWEMEISHSTGAIQPNRQVKCTLLAGGVAFKRFYWNVDSESTVIRRQTGCIVEITKQFETGDNIELRVETDFNTNAGTVRVFQIDASLEFVKR